MEIEMETKPFDWNINLSNTIDKKKRKIIEKYYIKFHSILEYFTILVTLVSNFKIITLETNPPSPRLLNKPFLNQTLPLPLFSRSRDGPISRGPKPEMGDTRD